MTIDRACSGFDGYTWGQNTGWIHFYGTGDAGYGVSLLMRDFYLPLALRSS